MFFAHSLAAFGLLAVQYRFCLVVCMGEGERTIQPSFGSQTVHQTLGSTVAHSARVQEAPASMVQRMYQKALPAENERLLQLAWKQAKDQAGLVLCIDDFAIKKGHMYNTDIHDLRGETMLVLLSGRKLDALRAYAEQHPEFLSLNPKAAIMDLAQTYHT
ncbi:transposase [Paenibacillus sp. FSL L8-0644]|uniref:transposase n=1 Tax=Paenibacillus sp. FSL L8-0644 TaxID=2954523 RepID=UPI0030F63A73